NVPPDLAICTFILEQSLSVRALVEMLANTVEMTEAVDLDKWVCLLTCFTSCVFQLNQHLSLFMSCWHLDVLLTEIMLYILINLCLTVIHTKYPQPSLS
ncbi:hypothetical protein GOODEAATRI_018529, partial [Goodea atripinnis]